MPCAAIAACLPASQPVGVADTGTTGATASSDSGSSGSTLDTARTTGDSSSSGTESTGSLDGTSTGDPDDPCSVCAPSDICVQDFHEKNCLCFGPDPFTIYCFPRRPEACDENLTPDAACTLALCGNPYAVGIQDGCGCGVDGDFNCGITFFGQPCDYWAGPGRACTNPGFKCVPALDEQY
ncbi:MAG: hypothetical protein KDK70_33020, partial [Myxococcales bacterium]|nr:hypothetical protein [Myxococcales bacterium]